MTPQSSINRIPRFWHEMQAAVQPSLIIALLKCFNSVYIIYPSQTFNTIFEHCSTIPHHDMISWDMDTLQFVEILYRSPGDCSRTMLIDSLEHTIP